MAASAVEAQDGIEEPVLVAETAAGAEVEADGYAPIFDFNRVDTWGGFAEESTSLTTRAYDTEVKNLIANAFENFDTSINGLLSYNLSQSEFDKLFAEVLDNPKYWYVVQYGECDKNNAGIMSSVDIVYVTDTARLNEYIAAVNNEIQKAQSWIQYGMSDDQKAQVLHDYLVRNVVYPSGIDVNGDYNVTDPMFNAYGALVRKSAVCEGYVQAYKVLLNSVGINSVMVTSEKMNHAWNMVQIDGGWYHVDVTWDDAQYTQYGGDLGFDVESKIGSMHHDFFLRSDAVMSSTPNGFGAHENWKAPTTAAADYYKLHSTREWPVYNSSIVSTYPTSTQEGAVVMYRMYNPFSGEHFYTAGLTERSSLIREGWVYENIAWYAPTSGAPVYRLYNEFAGDHHYTASAYERDYLVSVGWKDEGVGWNTEDSNGQPLYRLYNPNAVAGAHHYTTDMNEYNTLSGIGWVPEGEGWYGVR